MLCGVGGQGTILAADVLAKVAAAAGLDVKLSEVHGMAQRGGSVDTVVRFGEEVFAPITDPGGADHLVAFEMIEAARRLQFLKPEGRLLVNARVIEPLPVLIGAVPRRRASRPRSTTRAPSSSTPRRSRARRAARSRRTSCSWGRSRPGSPFAVETLARGHRGARAAQDRGGEPARVRAGTRGVRTGGVRPVKVKQLSVFIENKAGRVSEVTDLLGKAGVNIRGFSVSDTADYGIVRLVVDEPDAGMTALQGGRVHRQGERRHLRRTFPTSRAGSPACSRSSRTPA